MKSEENVSIESRMINKYVDRCMYTACTPGTQTSKLCSHLKQYMINSIMKFSLKTLFYILGKLFPKNTLNVFPLYTINSSETYNY